MLEINKKKLCESCFCETGEEEACPHCGFNRSEYTPALTVLPMGTKLDDRIIIGKVMGKGGFGITYLGYDLRSDKAIAVKEYYPNGISYRAPGGTEVAVADMEAADTFESGAEKFYSEAEMVSQFNGNPNIVSVYDYFRENNTVYLIMEYLSGITLKNYVKKRGSLTDGQALYVMDKITAALSITHSAGVLHRDISPDNIMLCRDGRIKLIDFGAARQILTESSSNLTVVMKPGYTPIEQYTKKGKQGAWTDIYSLGVSMYYALTKTIIDDPYARMENDEEFAENRHNINESLWTIIKKCTMINASDRYGSAIELRRDLKSVSAPLTAEKVELSDWDLKDEQEENDQTDGFAPTVPLDGDVTADGGDTAEELEASGNNAPDEGTDGVSDAPTDAPDKSSDGVSDTPTDAPDKSSDGVSDTPTDAPAAEKQSKAEKRSKPAKKGKATAAVCSAAALVIIVVICVFVGIGGKKVTIRFNEDYPGDWQFQEKGIEKSELLQFGGDVKVTLNLKNLGYDKPKYIQLRDGDRNSPNTRRIPVTAVNKGPDYPGEETDDLWYCMYYVGQETFTFIISRDTIDSINNSLRFGVVKTVVESAVLEDYDPSEYEAGRGAVTVDINSARKYSATISRETFQELGGDVRVVLDIEYKRTYEYDEDPAAVISVMTYNPTDRYPAINVENTTPYVYRTDRTAYYLGRDDVPDKFIFTISREETDRLGLQGMLFYSENLYIRSASLEPCK